MKAKFNCQTNRGSTYIWSCHAGWVPLAQHGGSFVAHGCKWMSLRAAGLSSTPMETAPRSTWSRPTRWCHGPFATKLNLSNLVGGVWELMLYIVYHIHANNYNMQPNHEIWAIHCEIQSWSIYKDLSLPDPFSFFFLLPPSLLRCVLLICLVICCEGTFFVEQPRSSLMIEYHRFQWLTRLVQVTWVIGHRLLALYMKSSCI